MIQAERTTTRLMRHILAILLRYYIATILLVRSSSTPAQPPSRRARCCDILHRQDCTTFYEIFYDILHDILRAAAQPVYDILHRKDCTIFYDILHDILRYFARYFTIFYTIFYEQMRNMFMCVIMVTHTDIHVCTYIINAPKYIWMCSIDGVYMHCLRRGGSSPRPTPSSGGCQTTVSIFYCTGLLYLNKFIHTRAHTLLYIAFERKTRSTPSRLNKNFAYNITIFIILYYIILYYIILNRRCTCVLHWSGRRGRRNWRLQLHHNQYNSYNHIDSYFHIGAEDEVYVIYD